MSCSWKQKSQNLSKPTSENWTSYDVHLSDRLMPHWSLAVSDNSSARAQTQMLVSESVTRTEAWDLVCREREVSTSFQSVFWYFHTAISEGQYIKRFGLRQSRIHVYVPHILYVFWVRFSSTHSCIALISMDSTKQSVNMRTQCI